MKRINNIFYSLQGEGRNTGRAAVFIRFAGCNLRCSFCDTEFESYREMSDEEILDAVKTLVPSNQTPFPLGGVGGRLLIVLTGGEPTLQVDEAFVDLLHQHDYEVAMESNGTRFAPRNLDWLTVSPKQSPIRQHCNEVKVIFVDAGHVPDIELEADYYYLQPCDVGDAERNKAITQACVEYIKQHPQWRLSLQTHKLIDIE
jgi:organic radical activating enzyme